MKKLFIILIVIFFILIFLQEPKEPLRAAACPTFYYMLEKLEKQRIEIFPTQSTSESLALLEKKEVDFIISGRRLKEKEPDYYFKIIGPGYDFLFQEEIIISKDQIPEIPFYTDLSLTEIKRDFPEITQIEKVNDLENYLEKGVIITQDRPIGEIVHVFDNQGSRIRLSRLPRLYYSELSFQDLESVLKIIKE